MDVHRSRFVPYPPPAINALAFSQPSGTPRTSAREGSLRLAVGRANGDIEIWNPLRGAWAHETTFRGGKDRYVEELAWIREPDEEEEDGSTTPGRLRLFSIGYSIAVTEWDLATGLPLRHCSGNANEMWCLAAQPRWDAQKPAGDSPQALTPRDGELRGQNIVAGCADGTLTLLSTANDDLQFQRYLTRPTKKQARCLSVTWQNRNNVVAGFADSYIRVFDSRNGSLIRQISLGGGPTGGPKEILVWTVKCLPDGDIVSGDSTGEVRFFDGKHYSQLQRIAAHEADVLALATSGDGETLFSAGTDRRTVTYRLGSAKGTSKRRFWFKQSHQRHHSHDVKALASFESKHMSVLVSGGIDTDLQIHPIRGHGDQFNRGISGLPQQPPVSSVRAGRLLVSWWDRELWIWQISRDSKRPDGHKLMTKINLQGEENITSVSISAKGNILAVATAAEVKMFRMQLKGVAPFLTLRVRKMEISETLNTQGARCVQISPDSKWLAAVRLDNSIKLIRIVHDDETGTTQLLPTILELKRHSAKSVKAIFGSESGNYERLVTRIQFSHDGRVFVASDLMGHIDSWVLQGHQDNTAPQTDIDDGSPDSDDEEENGITFFGQRWQHTEPVYKIPKLDSAPIILTFRPTLDDSQPPEPNGNPAVHPIRNNPHPQPDDLPTGDYRLVVLTARHHLYEFSALSGKMTAWSQRNTTSTLPVEFKKIRDRAMGCMWHVTPRWQRLWLYGSQWLFMLDMAQDFDDMAAPAQADGRVVAKVSKKRKRDEREAALQLGTSGAGSKKKRSEEIIGYGEKVRRLSTSEDGQRSEWVRVQQAGPSEDEELDSDTPADALVPIRSVFDESEGEKEERQDGGRKAETRFWYTYKYRPILGIVPLSEPVEGEGREWSGRGRDDEALEVVLVERPSWDLDLPEPFVGVHERE